jgi:hypothetical protein
MHTRGRSAMTRKPETQKIDAALERAAGLRCELLAGLAEQPVGAPVAVATLRRTLGGPLPDARPEVHWRS